MLVRTYKTGSEEETIAAGRDMAGILVAPAVVLLIGDLGAGKTTFTKGLVDGLQAADPNEVSSPTFTLIHEYAPGIWHLDLYRLETEKELATLGLEDLLSAPGGVLIVEWGERFRTFFPDDAWLVRIVPDSDDRREIKVERQADSSLPG